jgi:hypothetical protein
VIIMIGMCESVCIGCVAGEEEVETRERNEIVSETPNIIVELHKVNLDVVVLLFMLLFMLFMLLFMMLFMLLLCCCYVYVVYVVYGVYHLCCLRRREDQTWPGKRNQLVIPDITELHKSFKCLYVGLIGLVCLCTCKLVSNKAWLSRHTTASAFSIS